MNKYTLINEEITPLIVADNDRMRKVQASMDSRLKAAVIREQLSRDVSGNKSGEGEQRSRFLTWHSWRFIAARAVGSIIIDKY